MKSDKRYILICLPFLIILFGTMLFQTFSSDKELSAYERRQLEKFPEITVENISTGRFFEKLERYFQDQFPARDKLRGLKNSVNLQLFLKQDTNNLFLDGDEIYYIEYPLDEKSILNAAKKFNTIYDMYFDETNRCYCSVIPDKTYYNPNGRPVMDYELMEKLLVENVKNMDYINLFDTLDKSDYYLTDSHWKQENLQDVVNALAQGMNFVPADFSKYNANHMGEWGGVYYGRLAMDTPKDSMVYLTNSVIENAEVYNYETQKYMQVYATEKFEQDLDKYNIFLSGPESLITIYNHNAKTEKELIIFRDSFGSSLAPMLLESYKSITLVDLRYISASMLADYIEFKNKDILFLYSAAILNNSTGLKV